MTTVKTILVVDDEIAIVGILTELLQDEGYSVVPIYSGIEAMELFARKEIYDLMIIDFCMPYANGTQVIETVRKNPFYKELPIIIITGSEKNANVFPRGDMYQAIITKPFDLDEIVDVVSKLLNE